MVSSRRYSGEENGHDGTGGACRGEDRLSLPALARRAVMPAVNATFKAQDRASSSHARSPSRAYAVVSNWPIGGQSGMAQRAWPFGSDPAGVGTTMRTSGSCPRRYRFTSACRKPAKSVPAMTLPTPWAWGDRCHCRRTNPVYPATRSVTSAQPSPVATQLPATQIHPPGECPSSPQLSAW
jgi:hypothetical protein